MIHLDTDVVIGLLADRSPLIRARFEGTQAARIPIGLSVIAYDELMYGAARSSVRGSNEKSVAFFIANGPLVLLAFGEADAREAADIREHLRRAGTPIGNFDLLIAAQARRAGASLVTNNRREFDRVPRPHRHRLGRLMDASAVHQLCEEADKTSEDTRTCPSVWTQAPCCASRPASSTSRA